MSRARVNRSRVGSIRRLAGLSGYGLNNGNACVRVDLSSHHERALAEKLRILGKRPLTPADRQHDDVQGLGPVRSGIVRENGLDKEYFRVLGGRAAYRLQNLP